MFGLDPIDVGLKLQLIRQSFEFRGSAPVSWRRLRIADIGGRAGLMAR
jgi:hypothetical protein